MALGSLAEIERAPLRASGVGMSLTCDGCGALVHPSMREQHEEWHRNVVAWLRALRDGKADA